MPAVRRHEINLLLAQCYGHLGEPEKQRDADRRGPHIAAPQDLTTHLDWIAYLLNEGNTEEAIKEYRAIVDQVPQVRLKLVRTID